MICKDEGVNHGFSKVLVLLVYPKSSKDCFHKTIMRSSELRNLISMCGCFCSENVQKICLYWLLPYL